MNEGMTERQVQEARRMLAWLCFECPLGGNPADCPAHALRLQSFELRRRTLTRMSDEECVELYAKHKVCLVRKETAGGRA